MTPNIDHISVSRRTVLQVTGGSIATYVARPFSGGGGGDSDHEDGSDGTEDAVVSQTVDVIGQGPDGGVVADAGETIHRTTGEILMAVSMPKPEPGTYTYPSAPADKEGEWWTDETGDLEAFSLWAFVYNDPGDCETPCSGDDLGMPADGGAFYVDGHVFDGQDLALNGSVSTDADPFEMDGDPLGVPLERPMDAEVHLAVAPHGAFDPAMLPDQLRTPTNPGPDIWWLATFEPP